MTVISGKFDLAVFTRLAGKPLDFRHGLFGNEGTRLVRESRKGVIGFSECQAMTVSCDHSNHIGLQSQLSAV